MRKLTLAAIAAVAILGFNCSGSESEIATKAVDKDTIQSIKLAYVQVDTLLSQYNLSKELNKTLLNKEENARATLNQRSKTLQSQMEEFQRKLENNAFVTEERVRQEQQRLVGLQGELQELQTRLTTELDNAAKTNSALLRDSVQNYLKVYNKKHNYSMIFSNSGMESLLYADEAFDITKDIVKGLNARYNPKD